MQRASASVRPTPRPRGALGLILIAAALVGVAIVSMAPETRAQAPKPGGALRVALHLEPTTLDPRADPRDRRPDQQGHLREPGPARPSRRPEAAPGLELGDVARREDLDVQAPRRRQVPRRDAVRRPGRQVHAGPDRRRLRGWLVQPGVPGSPGALRGCRSADDPPRVQEPYPALLDGLETGYLAIVSPTAVKKHGKEFGQHPVGTGSYVFESWTRGQQVVLKKNPAYNWAPAHMKHQGPGYVDEIVYRFIPEHQTRLATLEKGEVDLIGRAPGPDVAASARTSGSSPTSTCSRGRPPCPW